MGCCDVLLFRAGLYFVTRCTIFYMSRLIMNAPSADTLVPTPRKGGGVKGIGCLGKRVDCIGRPNALQLTSQRIPVAIFTSDPQYVFILDVSAAYDPHSTVLHLFNPFPLRVSQPGTSNPHHPILIMQHRERETGRPPRPVKLQQPVQSLAHRGPRHRLQCMLLDPHIQPPVPPLERRLRDGPVAAGPDDSLAGLILRLPEHGGEREGVE